MLPIFFHLVVILSAYLMGSVCSAIIVCQLFSLPDPRKAGSKNPGATNVLRLAGKKYAAIVLVADMLKGVLPVLIAKLLGAGPVLLGFTCLAAIVGHVYPIFFDFKGGKGVATTLGALLAFHLGIGLLVVLTWLIVAYVSRYSSLSSMTAVLLAPLFSLFFFDQLNVFFPLLMIAGLVIFQHRQNIVRLIHREEPHVSFGKK